LNSTPKPRKVPVKLGQFGVVVALGLVACAAVAWAAAEKSMDIPGSRSPYVHRLEPMVVRDPDIPPDQRPKPVNPEASTPLPISFKESCTKCHSYNTVSHGWHFNAIDPAVPTGRPGEPWFWNDRQTGTQLPLSYRNWPNTHRPAEVGLGPWRFTTFFGPYTPGGGAGEPSDDYLKTVDEPDANWPSTGKLEINCQACHSGDPQYDHTAWGVNIKLQNFMWAATSTTNLASVTGSVKDAPGFNPWLPPLDENAAKAPAVRYDKSKFDPKGRIFFNIPFRSSNDRCYSCHSQRDVGPDAPEPWKTDQDVHLAAGLSCSDCHRNGPEHAMRRGYEGEPGSDDPRTMSLTCRGCHLGAQSAEAGPETMGGRLGAPVPKHAGLPSIHLKNLACTTCHSGPMPQARSSRIQTSRAHMLEYQGPFRGDDALPLIQNLAFARRAYDGLIGPQRMAWPAYWARLEGDKVTVLTPDFIYKIGKDEFDKKDDKGEVEKLSPAKISNVLGLLAESEDFKKLGKGEAVYIAGGRLYRRSGPGTLASSDHPAAEPVAWPIGHNVRPSARSLGSGGCTDCHGSESPVFFGEVVAETPIDMGEPPKTVAMYELLGKDPTELRAWSLSYKFRPFFKIVGFATAGLIGAVLLLYLFTGLAALARWASKHAPQRQG
jgi:hypothetical protein